jgi:hypothetical protein
MLSRGFSGSFPRLDEGNATIAQTGMAAALPAAAAVVALLTFLLWK